MGECDKWMERWVIVCMCVCVCVCGGRDVFVFMCKGVFMVGGS